MKKISLAIAATAVLFSAAASAAPVAATIGDFGSATTVNFNAVGDATAVGSTYAGAGVTFSGSLYGMTNSGDTALFPANGGGVIASNWIYGSGSTGQSFTVDFAAPVSQVGFYLENWPSQTLSVELFTGATSLGSFTFAQNSSLTAEFRGVSNSTAFDRAVFTDTASNNGFFAIDDLRFGNTAAVPEPTNVALLLAGLGALGVARRKSRKA